MQKCLLAAILFIICALVSDGSAQNKVRDSIKGIDQYKKGIDAFVERFKKPHAVFADVSDYENEDSKWERFGSMEALEKFREKTETYNMANVWLQKGRPVFCVLTFSSPSGDWVKYVSLYFRDDGGTAFSKSELRTFHGNFIARQGFYFSRSGRQLRRTINYFDLVTGKRMKPDASSLEDNSLFISEDNYYQRTSKLPFWHLLSEAK